MEKNTTPGVSLKGRYDSILFDLDGTLIDSSEGIFASLRHAFVKMGRDAPADSELYRFIGPPLIVSFSEFCSMSKEQTDRAVELYREYYETDGIRMYSLYSGVPELLSALSKGGKRLFLATSKPEVFARQILNDAGVLSYFDGVCGSDPDKGRESKSEVLTELLSRYSLVRERTVMVGDRKYDAVGARNLGLDFIGVLWGFGDKKELEAFAPVALAGDCGELAAALL